jgi:nucleoside phosphorylase
MPEELDFFKTKFSNLNFTEVNIGELTFKVYDYQNAKVLIAHSGIGTAFAAGVFTLIYSFFQPDYFLVSGTAGGIKEGMQLRDVVVAEKAFEAEMQDVFIQVKNTPFESCLKHPIKNECFPMNYAADPELLNIFNSLNLSNINRNYSPHFPQLN